MTGLTQNLIKQLPQFECLFRRYDDGRQANVNWRIVRSSVPFAETQLSDWKPLPPFIWKNRIYPNAWSSKTDPLEISNKLSHQWSDCQSNRHCSENGHPGVWELHEGDCTLWQTVLPCDK